MNKAKKLLKNPFVRKWMIGFIIVITALFLCFMIYTYIASQKQFQREVTAYSELQTEKIVAQIDDSLQSVQQVARSLSVDNNVNIFMFGENAQAVFPNLYTQIYQQLLAYCFGNSAIDSIYLYSAVSNSVFISGEHFPTSVLLPGGSDAETLLEEMDFSSGTSIIARKKGGIFPYVLSLSYPVYRSETTGIVTININVSRIQLLKNSSDGFQATYLVSDSGELLYRSGQQDMPESLSTVEQLQYFQPEQSSFSCYVDSESPYIFVQQHSERFPWYYVTVTSTQSYAGRSFNVFSSVLSFFPWLFFLLIIVVFLLSVLVTHPIRSISEFLDDPMAGVPKNISEPETEKIIRQLMNYIQTNQKLSDELTNQMERQNKATFLALQSQINPHFLFNTLNLIRNIEIDALGYDHEAPTLTLELSKLLRYAIDSTDLVPLDTELRYTALYLDILNQRYEKMLHFSIPDVPRTDEVLVPKLIIQPIIENAVFHGCSAQLETFNQIDVDVQIEEKRAAITVRDNGAGIAPEQLDALRAKLSDVSTLPRDSIGLQNVALRMYLTFGDAFTIRLDSALGQGTSITLSFPILTAKPE